ncbi:MAG: flagellar export protein FliJ [Pseudomonadales bacterium]|nr:flagellar export protein FliJ [Pseudomonadales bacterium]
MNTQSLDMLIDLAQKARDNAGQLLAGERLTGQQLDAQLKLLTSYREEYQQGLQQTMGSGIDLNTLRDYQSFLDSLDTAIVQARRSLEQQQEQINASQRHWQQQQRQLSSYNTLSDRKLSQAFQKAQRQEQRQTDERNGNSFARAQLRQAATEQ